MSAVLRMVARLVAPEVVGQFRALSRDIVVAEAIETEADQIHRHLLRPLR
jgi:hypothetical protein